MLNLAEAVLFGGLMVFVLIIGALAGAFVYLLAAIFPRSVTRVRPVNVLLACSLAPLCVVLLLSALVLVPSLASSLGFLSDHCHQDVNPFAGSCLPHRPVPLHDVLGWWVSILLAGIFLRFLFVLSRDFEDMDEILRGLKHGTKVHWGRGVDVVDSATPLAMSAGYPEARIFVSSTLIENLSDAQLAVVLAHERAHIRRHDVAKNLIARTASVLHFPAVRRWLLADLSLAIENACDEQTTEAVGDRLHVAETIVHVERLFGVRSPGQGAMVSMTDSSVPGRVNLLLAREPHAACRWCFPILGMIVVCLALLATTDPLHHFLELVFARA